jgi:hypothetical protein
MSSSLAVAQIRFLGQASYLLLVGLDLLDVEFELLALKDVTVAATRLAGARGNQGVETTGAELIIQHGVNLGSGLASGNLLQGTFRLLDLGGGSSLSASGSSSSLALLPQNLTIVILVPLAEGSRVHLNNGALNERLGADELVVRGVVDNVNDTGLARDGLAAPGEGTRVETEGTVLGVATASTHSVDALLTELGVGGLATELELSLLTILGTLGTGMRALVTAITANTYTQKRQLVSATRAITPKMNFRRRNSIQDNG